MIKYFLLFYLFFWTAGLFSKPLPVKLVHNIIIDTDCAIDDMRAISLLLSRPEINIKAIFLSDGTLPPFEGVKKIKALLHQFKRDSILVAYGKELKEINPPWREFNRQVSWGSNPEFQTAVWDVSEKLINEKITILCLGPLTNIAQLLNNNAQIKNKVERIIWYNGSINPMRGFNYECDKGSANAVIESGVRIDVISNLQKANVLFDTAMYAVCRQSKTQIGSVLFYVHSQPVVLEKVYQQHFRLCDELVSVYLTNPELFDITLLTGNVHVRYNKDYNAHAITEVISDMITGKYAQENNIVFREFPRNREMFTYDVRQIMDSAIALYGYDEWKANVLTDEFHGHLGVFSIVGAKMGIRAREIFGVGQDQLEVVTYAGTQPPYSCLNDGIQVSTGATLGMGTIHLANDSIRQPMAVFSYKGRFVKIKLKNEYLEQVDSDIDEGIVKFGLMDDGYWKLIRSNALKYWIEWDRNKIFDVEMLAVGSQY
jgi:inosine-uridine nucleoside N-ribohydrolase/formylmethanofuran dehydrogenase subunit E